MHPCMHAYIMEEKTIDRLFLRSQIPNTTLTRLFDFGANPSLMMGWGRRKMNEMTQSVAVIISFPLDFVKRSSAILCTRATISKSALLNITDNYEPLIDFNITTLVRCNKEVLYIGPPSFHSQLSSIEGS